MLWLVSVSNSTTLYVPEQVLELLDEVEHESLRVDGLTRKWTVMTKTGSPSKSSSCSISSCDVVRLWPRAL